MGAREVKRRKKREKLATTTESSGPEKVAGVGAARWWAGGRRCAVAEERSVARVHLTRTDDVVRACGRRINRCHHGDRDSGCQATRCNTAV